MVEEPIGKDCRSAALIGSGLLFVTAALFATAAPAQNRNGNGPNGNGLQEVVVTAMRVEKRLNDVPAAVDVVGRDEVQFARQQIGLDESLVQMPGLFMQNRYNFAQDLRLSIRGFGARANFGIRGIRIYVDGIPETLPDGQGQVDSIDLGSVERITVLRGSASSLYGNASGGVILIDSEEPPPEPMVEVRSSLGELGYRKHQLKTAGTAGKFSYLLNLSDFEMEGYRDQSEAEGRQVNGTLRYDIDPSSDIHLAINYTDQPVSDDPGALTRAEVATNRRAAAPAALTFDSGESLEQTRIGLAYNKSFGEQHSIRARTYYVTRSFENLLAFRAGGAVTIERDFIGGGLSYTNRSTLWGRNNRLIVGIDTDHQDDDRKRFNNDFGVIGAMTFDQNEKVKSTGIYLQNELSLTDALELTLGVRYDEVEVKVGDRFLSDGDDSGSRKWTETSPLVALLYKLTPNINLYANISTSFESPTTTELVNPSGGGGFNPVIGPQTATNYELGIKGAFNERNRFSAAIFRINVEDELIPFEVPGSPGRSFFRNAGESRREGLELAFGSSPIDGLNITLAYTYSDFVFEDFVDNAGNDFSGNKIPGLPDQVLHGEISWQHPSGFFAAFDAAYVDELFLDNANTEVNDSYTVANLRAGFSREHGPWGWSVFAGANNMFDEKYNANTRINAAAGRYFEPGPGASYYAGASFRYRFGS
jgi:iron complex outermembrane receptor protein